MSLTENGWCDVCRTNLQNGPHEAWCPVLRVAELELALVDLYNLCMAKGWGTAPAVREMLAARRALRGE